MEEFILKISYYQLNLANNTNYIVTETPYAAVLLIFFKIYKFEFNSSLKMNTTNIS